MQRLLLTHLCIGLLLALTSACSEETRGDDLTPGHAPDGGDVGEDTHDPNDPSDPDDPNNPGRAEGPGLPYHPGEPPPGTPDDVAQGVYYDIVYVRAPRYGDETNTEWPEVKDPIRMEPGTDLMLLRPDGSEEVLVSGGEKGAVIDPFVTFDGTSVLYSHCPDVVDVNTQRRDAPRAGCDIYRIELESRQIVRLTHQEWTPNTGAGNWSPNMLEAQERGQNYPGYGVFNLGATPLPGGKIMFTSSRDTMLPNKDFTFPNLRLYVMDADGKNVEPVGHLNLGSALHPNILHDGRVMFSSYESQGLRDQRNWALWVIYPDGRQWNPLMSSFASASSFHFFAQLSNGHVTVTEYYNQNNNGFGTLAAFPLTLPEPDRAPFGSPVPDDASNPRIQIGWYSNGNPQYMRFPFSPQGLYSLTPFALGGDSAASIHPDTGEFTGKVTHPSAAPHNDLLLVYTPGPANHLNRPTPIPYYDGGIYRLAAGEPVLNPEDLIEIKNDPAYNEQQPRAVVAYRDIYGIEEPARLSWLPEDQEHADELPTGSPFALLGSASLIKRDTRPGQGKDAFDGLEPFNTSQNNTGSNWFVQGADSGIYTDDDIWAVRIVAMETPTHRSYGTHSGVKFTNHANERLRILGEIPVRKFDDAGEPVVDPDGNPDTSFLAKIPADTPFTFQTLDRDGMVLNSSQTWHQLRPGEVRYDCGGCHAHSQSPTDFEATAAAREDYQIWDLTRTTPLLTRDDEGQPALIERSERAVDVEYLRDIQPLFERSCTPCHSESSTGGPAMDLVLDDTELIDGYPGTWHRLNNDAAAQWGIPPLVRVGESPRWRQANASRTIRKFQSRRSLLTWKVFGRRLDGWSNEDHPSASVPGDASTLPEGAHPNDSDLDYIGELMPPPGSDVPALTHDEKMTIARWIDLGSPVDHIDAAESGYGWFLDDLRPTLVVASPRERHISEPLQEIRFGAFDYYTALDEARTSVIADFEIQGRPAGSELADLFVESHDRVWALPLETPVSSGTITVTVYDQQGNQTRRERYFELSD
ncbi:hypothetical protein FRC98_02575 [Lujinxingia vulgaris]|uniref:Hydrazine synthase alpha subunit middle domain-containing protein n=1 Tax=Lujinxingia vulgaris TaxID=2600176 RepID=A0A5C6XFR9_9DELT|nr:hypothetical protein [Lujinxingia vulgaris]TXD39303.1 hypothetical protein FRC98_02575 [Lujinxingia vulgaris]